MHFAEDTPPHLLSSTEGWNHCQDFEYSGGFVSRARKFEFDDKLAKTPSSQDLTHGQR